MGDFLTTASTLTCPHGGTVAAIPSAANLTAGGDPIVLATDTFTIAACPFILVVPHPCVLVQWIVPAARCTGTSAPMLTTDSVGLCVAADGAVQGPVLIQVTQTSAGGL
ncbi:hypothetical protein FK531_14295 [Rhodococcus spelaei]|uniref:DUF4280 domain-containing protein n=1 Tax=Rhodococcus spelaei TaxID=2546320 RepID=A0A541B7I7_9NOCA|nr:hypothetical protein [Rhodococcus spelaei]TQF68274.1 hypothetical protein FK531_14295 [Rhodococcus spelaei]